MHAPSLAYGARVPCHALGPLAWHSGAVIDGIPKGLSEDGTHLIVVADDGTEVRLAVTDELRALLRHARVVRPAHEARPTTMSPREIQQRIRSGLNAAELAQLTGEPVEALAKFEAPVLAERSYIVDLARQSRVGRGSTAPTLGDLVDDRLVARGVDPAAVRWDAWREVDEPWRVAADYVVAGKGMRALWTFDHTAKLLTAEDDEAAWLTETELLEAPIPRRHLAAVRPEPSPAEVRLTPVATPSPGVDAASPTTPAHDLEAPATTEELLQDLALRRGVREALEVDDDDDEVFEGFGPARGNARPGARGQGSGHPAGSARGASRGADSGAAAPTPAPGTPVPGASPVTDPAERRSRKGRASVPSWDEIVFGAKTD